MVLKGLHGIECLHDLLGHKFVVHPIGPTLLGIGRQPPTFLEPALHINCSMDPSTLTNIFKTLGATCAQDHHPIYSHCTRHQGGDASTPPLPWGGGTARAHS